MSETPNAQLTDGSPLIRKENKNVTFFGLLIIAFFWISGGLYGNEEMLQSGPPGVVFLLLLLTPILYSLPISLISVELSSAMPYEGGAVAWIQEACGRVLGGHNTYWFCFGYLVDTAIYPVLAAEYMYDKAKIHHIPRSVVVPLLASCLVVFVTVTKLLGIKALVRFSSLIAIMSMLPALLFVLIGADRMNPKDWVSFDTGEDGIDWSLALSWQIWLYSGFFGIGALTAEVENAHVVILKVVAILIPVLILINTLPLMVGLGINDDLSLYSAGFFDTLGQELAGKWLGTLFTIGSQVCMIGLYNTQTIICERSVVSFVLSRLGKKNPDNLNTWWLRFLFDEASTGVGRAYILGIAIGGLICVWIPYEILVELSALFFCISLSFFFYSFIYFKVTKPDMPRPFKIPGGLYGGILVAICPFCLGLANLYFSATDDAEVHGIAYFKVLVLDFVILLGIIVHICFAYRVRILGFLGIHPKDSLGSDEISVSERSFLLPRDINNTKERKLSESEI